METLKNLTLIQWIGIAVGLNSLLMGATPQLTVLFGEHAVPYIIAIATLGNGALGVFVTVIGGQGSQVRNVLAMPGVEKIAVNGQANATLAAIAVDPLQNKIAPTPAAMDKVTAAAKAAIVLALLAGGLLAFAGDASAQVKLKPPQVTGDFVGDARANLGIGQPAAAPALTGNIEKDVQALWKKIASLTKADLTYAMAKAKAAGTNGASIRLQCLQAISDANDQANGAGLKNPDGTDMVRPDPALVTAIEDAAELIDNLSPQGKLFTSCAGAAQMFKTNTLAAISAIVTGAAGIAALPAGL